MAFNGKKAGLTAFNQWRSGGELSLEPENLREKMEQENTQTSMSNQNWNDFSTNVFKIWIKNISLKKVTTREIPKCQFNGFYRRSSDFLTNILEHVWSAKKTKKIAIEQAHMQLKLLQRALRLLFGYLFKSADLKNWEQKEPGSEKNLKANIDISVSVFSFDKCYGILNGIGLKMEYYLEWNKIFRLVKWKKFYQKFQLALPHLSKSLICEWGG